MPYLDYIRGNLRLWNVPWNIVDFETTQGPPREPIEIAIVPMRDGEIDNSGIYSTLLCPSNPPPWRLLPHVPITPDMLKYAPTFKEVKTEIRRQLISGVFVQHAHGEARGFDAKIASEVFGVNANRIYVFSSIKLCKRLNPKARIGHSLEALCRRYRVSNSMPHRARPDALATAKAFLKMLECLYDNNITTFSRFEAYYRGK